MNPPVAQALSFGGHSGQPSGRSVVSRSVPLTCPSLRYSPGSRSTVATHRAVTPGSRLGTVSSPVAHTMAGGWRTGSVNRRSYTVRLPVLVTS